jgi:hypothetical protein
MGSKQNFARCDGSFAIAVLRYRITMAKSKDALWHKFDTAAPKIVKMA